MLKLPIDISTFSELRTSGYLYVDKTEYVYKMITGGRRFFLSRPRRFGKSLFVSTLYETLKANTSLFKDLWIGHSDYPWKEYGIIKLDFSAVASDDIITFKESLKTSLFFIAKNYQISLDNTSNSPSDLLQSLVHELFIRFGRVAILIDEYDGPILKTLYDQELAKKIRDTIQQFFTVIKSLDAQVQFVFITGVSSFAKAGLFSGINNLRIMTLDDRYASICGYTDTEVDHYFTDHITAWAQQEDSTYDKLREQIKTWYNGYRFSEKPISVYNPFSLLNALDHQKCENFWFQSGTPKFLVDILKKESHKIDLELPIVSKDFLGIFDVDIIPPVSLMFQAGYLTISEYDQELGLFKLDYPNREVRTSFQKYLLELFTHINADTANALLSTFKDALIKENIERVIDVLHQLFAHIPYQIHIKEEKYYHSLFTMICIGAQIKVQSEYSTSLGSIDLVLEFEKLIYVIEVKFNKTTKEALNQIHERKYYQRFLHQGKPVILLGLNFKREPNLFDITYLVEKL